MSSSSDSERVKYSAPAAACSADLLLFLAQAGRPQSLADIARAIDSSKSLVFRVVKELSDRQLVESEPDGLYRLGIEALELGGAYIQQSDYSAVVRRELRDLSRQTGETVNMGVLRGSDVLYVMKEEGANSIVSISQVGRRIPANCTALGKALLAELSESQIRKVLKDPLPSITKNTITSVSELLSELELVHQRSYAVDAGETIEGRCCMGVAVRLMDSSSDASAAISVSMTESRFEESEALLAAYLLETKDRLEREFSWRETLLTGEV